MKDFVGNLTMTIAGSAADAATTLPVKLRLVHERQAMASPQRRLWWIEDDPVSIAWYNAIFDHLRTIALTTAKSLAMISEAEELL